MNGGNHYQIICHSQVRYSVQLTSMGNLCSKANSVVPVIAYEQSSSMTWVHGLHTAYSKPIVAPIPRAELTSSKRGTKTSCSSRSSTRRGSYNAINGESCRDFTYDEMIEKLRRTQRKLVK